MPQELPSYKRHNGSSVKGTEPAAHRLRGRNADGIVTFPQRHHALIRMEIAMDITMTDGEPQTLPDVHLQQNFVRDRRGIRLTINGHFALSVLRYECAKNAATPGHLTIRCLCCPRVQHRKPIFHLVRNCTTQSLYKSIGHAIGCMTNR